MPTKIERIASTIAEIFEGSRPGKIKFVIGDGFFEEIGIRSRERIIRNTESQGKEVRSINDQDIACWKVYEVNRVVTNINLSPKRHYYIHHLCSSGYVGSLITTNYDLRFDAIFSEDPLPQGVVLNPAINDGDDSREGLFGNISEITTPKLCYWKIHGSFSHISFLNPETDHNHILKLPDPAVDPIYDYNMLSYDHHRALGLSCECERMAHFIDMNFSRDYFSKVIDGAVSDLRADDTGMILCIGFTGQYNTLNPGDPRNEELVPHLIDLSASKPVYTIVASHQDIGKAHLYRALDATSIAFQGDINPILREILKTLYDKMLIDGNKILRGLDKAYLSWRNKFNPIPY